jgi:hypothetical protein
LSGHLKAAQSRHHQVEDQNVWPETVYQAERFEPIGGLAHKPEAGLGLQQGSQSLPDDLMIIRQ